MDSEELIKKINKIRQQVFKSTLPQRIGYIFENVKHYPYWLKDKDDKKSVPNIVKSAKIVSPKTNTYKVEEIVEIEVSGDKYRFIQTKESRFNEFYQPTNPYEDLYYYPLELRMNGKKVFAVDDPLENPDDILVFVDGVWVEEMNKLYEAIDEIDKKKEVQNEEGRLDTLKKDFGL